MIENALIGIGPLAGTARAAAPGGLAGYAPVPSGALGPALNPDGYFAGNIRGNLYWVTDSVYQAMFVTTRDGVVLVDAPPTWCASATANAAACCCAMMTRTARRRPSRSTTITSLRWAESGCSSITTGPTTTMASLDPAPFFAEYGNNSWAIFKAYLDAAAAKVAAPVIAKYLGRLAAADVFTADNAYVMFEALRVDYGTLGPFGDHP